MNKKLAILIAGIAGLSSFYITTHSRASLSSGVDVTLVGAAEACVKTNSDIDVCNCPGDDKGDATECAPAHTEVCHNVFGICVWSTETCNLNSKNDGSCPKKSSGSES